MSEHPLSNFDKDGYIKKLESKCRELTRKLIQEISFKKLSERAFDEYTRNGFLHFWNRNISHTQSKLYLTVVIRSDLAELGLVITELSNCMELIRDCNYTERLDHELADTVIRIMNFARRKGIDLENAILEAINENVTRPERHGRKMI